MKATSTLLFSIAFLSFVIPSTELSAQDKDGSAEIKKLKERLSALEKSTQKEIHDLKKIIARQRRDIDLLRRHLRLPLPLNDNQDSPDPFHLLSGPLPAVKEATLPQPKDAKEGANKATEDKSVVTVEAELRWLKLDQNADGSWSSPGHKHDVAATSLALLAFMGNGHTHRFGTFKLTVRKGLKWLKQQQTEQGSFKVPAISKLPVLDQALATMALSELFAVSRDYILKKYAQRGCDFLYSARAEQGWAWTSRAKTGNSLMTSFAVLAFKAGKVGGLKIPPEAFNHATVFYDTVTAKDGLVGYKKVGDAYSLTMKKDESPKLPLFTSAAVISRVFCGQRLSQGKLSKSVQVLSSRLPQVNSPEPLYWYFGTYSMFQKGGKEWSKWNKHMLHTVAKIRDKDGSFKPMGLIGQLCGRAGSTGLCALTTEIYYRYERSRR